MGPRPCCSCRSRSRSGCGLHAWWAPGPAARSLAQSGRRRRCWPRLWCSLLSGPSADILAATSRRLRERSADSPGLHGLLLLRGVGSLWRLSTLLSSGLGKWSLFPSGWAHAFAPHAVLVGNVGPTKSAAVADSSALLLLWSRNGGYLSRSMPTKSLTCRRRNSSMDLVQYLVQYRVQYLGSHLLPSVVPVAVGSATSSSWRRVACSPAHVLMTRWRRHVLCTLRYTSFRPQKLLFLVWRNAQPILRRM